MLNDIFLASIPIFFAMDPVGLLPVFVGLTEGISSQEKKKIIAESLVTAALVAVGFIFLGRIIFHMLGITMGDFMAAVCQRSTPAWATASTAPARFPKICARASGPACRSWDRSTLILNSAGTIAGWAHDPPAS